MVQTWKASRTSTGFAVWQGEGVIASFNPAGFLEIVDMVNDSILSAFPGETANTLAEDTFGIFHSPGELLSAK